METKGGNGVPCAQRVEIARPPGRHHHARARDIRIPPRGLGCGCPLQASVGLYVHMCAVPRRASGASCAAMRSILVPFGMLHMPVRAPTP